MYYIYLIFFLTFFSSCIDSGQCNDCLELTTKSLRYVDSDGNNLFFGDQAIYDPESIVITAGSGETVDVWLQEETGTIDFDLARNTTTYRVVLPNTFADDLTFELGERSSNSCCGNVIFSSSTNLNGQEVDNNDLIVITID